MTALGKRERKPGTREGARGRFLRTRPGCPRPLPPPPRAVTASSGPAPPARPGSSSRFPVELPSRAGVIARDLASPLLAQRCPPPLAVRSPRRAAPAPCARVAGPRALGAAGAGGGAGSQASESAPGGSPARRGSAWGGVGRRGKAWPGIPRRMPTRVRAGARPAGARRRRPSGPPLPPASEQGGSAGVSALPRGLRMSSSCHSRRRQRLSLGAPPASVSGLSWRPPPPAAGATGRAPRRSSEGARGAARSGVAVPPRLQRGEEARGRGRGHAVPGGGVFCL